MNLISPLTTKASPMTLQRGAILRSLKADMGFDWALIPVSWKRAMVWGIMIGFPVNLVAAAYAGLTGASVLLDVTHVIMAISFVPFYFLFLFRVFVPFAKRKQQSAELLKRMKEPGTRDLYSKKTRRILESRSAND